MKFKRIAFAKSEIKCQTQGNIMKFRKHCKILKSNKNFRKTRILNLCYYYMKCLSCKETLYLMYDQYSSLILFQKEAEQRSTELYALWLPKRHFEKDFKENM